MFRNFLDKNLELKQSLNQKNPNTIKHSLANCLKILSK